MKNLKLFNAILSNKVYNVTISKFKQLYEVNFSEVGSNKRNDEDNTIYSFEVFLQDLEEGAVADLRLEDLLVFTTGADKVPPFGFPHPLVIEFYDSISGEKRLPWSSTCGLQLFLP